MAHHKETTMKSTNVETIEQTVTFEATPVEVYEALLDSAKHTAFSGAPASVSREIGGAFSCHDGCISGINIELVEGMRVVQAWRGKMFPAGVYSVVSFALEALEGGKKTRLAFTQHGVPADFAEMIAKGWQEHYWSPLTNYLENQRRAAA
jgi:activator of HSP90 ATPase